MGLWVILPNSNALKYSVSDPNCSLNWPGIRLTFRWIIKPFSRSINYHFPGRSIINNNHFTGHSSHRGIGFQDRFIRSATRAPRRIPTGLANRFNWSAVSRHQAVAGGNPGVIWHWSGEGGMCYDCLWFEMCRYFGLYLLLGTTCGFWFDLLHSSFSSRWEKKGWNWPSWWF